MTPARHIRTPFMDPLVRAIAADEKTVTRRLIHPQPTEPILWYPAYEHKRGLAYDGEAHFRKGWAADFARCKPGDIMDVCEALVPVTLGAYMDGPDPCEGGDVIAYRADGFIPWGGRSNWPWKVRVLPARYCPTGCVRHHRRLISVRPERLSEVTDAEAVLEGIRYLGWPETREGFLTGFRALHKLAADADSWVERREWAPGEVTGE